MKKTLTIFSLLLASFFSAKAQYCVPAPGMSGCALNNLIDDVIVFGENGSSIIHQNSGCSVNAYDDQSGTMSVSMGQGSTYGFTISSATQFGDNLAMWIDFNNDFNFDGSEMVAGEFDIQASGTSIVVNIPLTAPLGPHRMRVALEQGIFPSDIDPCNTGVNASDFGEMHDYTVTVTPPPTCQPPINLFSTGSTQTSIDVAWTGTAPLYSVEYGAPGFLPGNGTYTTTNNQFITLSPLGAGTFYEVHVRALCSTTDSSTFSVAILNTQCAPTANIPYTEDFNMAQEPAIPICMSTEDNNFDLATWESQSGLVQSAPKAAVYFGMGIPANDWLFTPGLNVTAGTTYQITFSYATEGSFPESLEVKAGNAPTATSMGATAYYLSTTLQNTVYNTTSFNYTASTTGVIYFGWHIFSSANSIGLVLDDIIITPTTTTVCDTSLTLTASAVTFNSANLAWSAVTGASGYEYVLDQTAGLPTSSGTPTTGTSFSASSLTASATYYFHVRSTCGNAYSPWKTVSFTTLPLPLCDTSLTLTASGVTANSATLTWSAVTGASGYQYVLDQVSTNPTSGTPTTATTFPATGLTPNTTYYFHLRTACGTTFSGWKTVSFTTQPVSVIDVNANTAGIHVYPNPVTDMATIELSALADNAQVQLTDISGKVLQTIAVKGTRTELNMSKLAAGIYMIRYSDATQQQLIKVVKQ